MRKIYSCLFIFILLYVTAQSQVLIGRDEIKPFPEQITNDTERRESPSYILRWSMLQKETDGSYVFKIKTPLSFNCFGFGWELSDDRIEPDAVNIQYRVKNSSGWKEWIYTEGEVAPDQTPTQLYWSELLFTNDATLHEEIELKIFVPDGIHLNSARMDILNTSGDDQLPEGVIIEEGNQMPEGINSATCPALPPIIPRSQWCGSYTACHNAGYSVTYINATHVVIHHGASPNTYSDGYVIVRSYWNYHVNTLGWADIGYNYLTDKFGNLFQGRKNVNMPTSDVRGSHAGNANGGSIGFNFLGNADVTLPTTVQLNICKQFLAWWFKYKNLDPTASAGMTTQAWGWQVKPRICGHRDINSTFCPGNTLYGQLPSIRTGSKAIIDACNGGGSAGTPPPPTVSTNNCGPKTLTRSAPPSGVTYYWQGTSCGTSAANSNQTYTSNTSGTYFLRARNISSGSWSTCSSVSVTVNPYPSTPPTPSASTNSCGNKTLTRGTPPSGVTYYWQGTSCGTSTANSSLNFTAASSGTYYLRARSSAGCWSTNCSSVSVTVTPGPATPPIPSESTNSCGPKSLTRATPPSGVTYYWQGTSCGTSTANSSVSYNVNTSGTYFLRALNSQGCWSSCSSIGVTVEPCPVNLSTSVGQCPQADVTFSWSNASSSWILEVSLDPAFNTLFSKPATNATTITAPQGFTPAMLIQPNATYYWRINLGGGSYTNGAPFKIQYCDNGTPTTSIDQVQGWQYNGFTASFNDTDNTGGTGIGRRFYRILEYNGTEWRANPERGFFNDNFDINILHPDWSQITGAWDVSAGMLHQTDDSENNTNLSSPLIQNLSNRYLYHWQAKIDGQGTDRRAGLHFFCSDDNLPNRGNSYFVWFRIDDKKLQFYKVVNEVYTQVKSTDYNFIAGQFYDFKLVFDRILGRMDMYINNVLAESWDDATPHQSGEYVSFRTGNATMDVNFLKVYRTRYPTVTVDIGPAASNDIRFENGSPVQAAGKIESIVADVVGNLSAQASIPVHVDWTPPEAVSIINDGTGADISTTYSSSVLSANWLPSSDPNSGVVKYYYSIGTSSNDSNIVGWTDNQLQILATRTNLSLNTGTTYFYNVKAENGAGLFSLVSSSDGQMVVDNPLGINKESSAVNLKIYPNPFMHTSTIEYTLLNKEEVNIALYDLIGKKVVILANATQSGEQKIILDPVNLGISEGIYMLVFKTETTTEYFKIIHSK